MTVVVLLRELGPLDERATAARAELARRAQLVEVPLVRTGALVDAAAMERLDAARRDVEAGRFDWVLFTSARGVAAWPAVAPASTGGARVGAVGERTARAVRDRFPDAKLLVPGRATGLELAAELAALPGGVAGQRILLVRVDIAADDLPEALIARGAMVESVVAYLNLGVQPEAGDQLAALLAGRCDVILVPASSAARALAGVLAAHGRALPDGCRLIAIGPSTRDACAEAGLGSAIMAEPHDLAGLLATATQLIDAP